MNFWQLFCLMIAIIAIQSASTQTVDIEALRHLVDEANKNLAQLYNKEVSANYKNEVENVPDNLNESEEATNRILFYIKNLSDKLKAFDVGSVTDEYLKRQIKRLPKVGYEALNTKDFQELQVSILKMNQIYRSVHLCSYRESSKCDLTLIPDIQDILHSTNDVKEIEYYWLEWRNKTGIHVRDSFNKFMKLYQKTAELNDFDEPSQMWYNNFDQGNTLSELETIINELRPLFTQFHARIRFLLRQKYGPELIKPSWPYPQHLSEIFIGEAYRYDQNSHIDFPYPEKGIPNVTEILSEKQFTPKKFFDLASQLFTTIGMPEIPKSFWTENAKPIAHPEKIILNCWNKAWYFYGSGEIKFSYCPNIDFRQFLNMYEALTDVEYYQQFKGQPTIFQDEPLPNFSDAIGRVISMSASTPKYLEKVGILPKGTYDNEKRINRLYLEGARKVFLLPILFLLDKYRIQILESDITTWDNCAYWDMTEKYTGAIPPSKRTNSDFDAPSKLLVSVDDEYSSHIISIILQFQVYKNLCEKVGEYKKGNPEYPLDNCDLSDHPEIGEILKKAMSVGASKSWKEVLKILTGEDNLSSEGFLEYFQPLFNWLIESNKINQAEIGWINAKQCED